MNTFKSALTFAVLWQCLSANAAIIDYGTYTTDTSTGLEWRDLTDTTGLSHNYVSSQFGTGGLFEGWRYATLNDMHGLISSVDGFNYLPSATPDSGNPVSDYDATVGDTPWNLLFDYLGDTYALYPPEYEFIDGLFENGANITYAVLKDTTDNSDDRYNLMQGTKTPDYSSSFVGSFLVRDVAPVPVPAAVWLFGSGLVGLTGLAKRRKAGR